MPFQKRTTKQPRKKQVRQGLKVQEAPEAVEPQALEEERPNLERFRRVPLSQRGPLMFGKQMGEDSECVYRGVVEDDRRTGRVEMFKEAGWEPVRVGEVSLGEGVDIGKEPGSTISRASGGGATTYLMRKRRDWETEDLKPLEDKNKRLEEAIYGELNKDNRYGAITVGGRTEQRR